MAVTLALWSIKLGPGKPEIIEAQTDRRVTNIAIGDDSEAPSKSGRSTVKLTYPNVAYDEDNDDDSEEENITTVLCSLSVGKVEQVVTDIVLNEGGLYKFETTGENTIYVSGHIIDQRPFDSDSEGMSDEEEAYDLRDVSSDVEIEPEEYGSDASRFEEVHDAAAEKSLKRPRQSTDLDIDSSKLSKADKKKAKKQKGEDGKPVPVAVNVDASADKSDKPGKKDRKEKAETNGKALAEKELPGGLKIRDSKIGTGPQAKKGNTIQMRYIGKLTSGKVFDSNTKGKPFSFHLGAGEVIKGWDQGLVGMQAGGERVLTIPPALGYGKKGQSGIPGNATLIFECKLINIK
ncbi:peptidylprolyl isomerase [Guyanagaster necrorhizus]|uniref:peptidylprolyl isomerase n=1 Tax=Guyanagaster necrorhizus TaxID=856835 RepID=A0A9P7VUQ3_9AGAR|nr:peptidylprolyl isomerase [Guyanagaster necrorhizus MCA 3950]KAG7446216.1 peptidylprolyl isomerase [Guyanagaster necrorhizus MCA 3950]